MCLHVDRSQQDNIDLFLLQKTYCVDIEYVANLVETLRNGRIYYLCKP